MAMKQNNFYQRWQQAAKSGKTAARHNFLLKALPAICVVAVCLVGWLGLTLHTLSLRGQTADLRDWCYDEQNLQPYQQSLQDERNAETFRSLTNYTDSLTAALNSYPDVTSSLLGRIEAAGGSNIRVQFKSYSAASGELQFDAVSDYVIDIPSYIRALQDCGVFSSVTYTGYKADSGDDPGYAINMRCILAAPE